MKILARRLLIVTMTLVAWTAAAQQRASLEPSEYGRWEQLAAQRTPLSPDGRWLVYGITRSNRQNELRVQPSGGGSARSSPFRRAAGVLGRLALARLPDRLLRGTGSEAPQGQEAAAQDARLARARDRQDDDGRGHRVVFLQPDGNASRHAPLRARIPRRCRRRRRAAAPSETPARARRSSCASSPPAAT